MRCLPTALRVASVVLLACVAAPAAARKQHTIAFGRWINARWNAGTEEQQSVALKVRPLYVDDRMREFTTGDARDITDRLFVVRRAIRLNDQLPDEGKTARWRWEPAGWLMVDRNSGRVSLMNLPLFDPYQSAATWFRDYAAYCGLSDD